MTSSIVSECRANAGVSTPDELRMWISSLAVVNSLLKQPVTGEFCSMDASAYGELISSTMRHSSCEKSGLMEGTNLQWSNF